MPAQERKSKSPLVSGKDNGGRALLKKILPMEQGGAGLTRGLE